MAHLSSTFSHANSGRILVVLRGTYREGTRRDAGFPSSGGTAGNLSVRAFVGPAGATRRYTEPIDKNAPVATLEMDYPGGNVSWPFGTEEVAHINPTYGGLWSYDMLDMSITITLLKK